MYPRPSIAWQRQDKGIHYLYAFLETGRGSYLKKMMHMGCKGGFAHTVTGLWEKENSELSTAVSEGL